MQKSEDWLQRQETSFDELYTKLNRYESDMYDLNYVHKLPER